MVVVKKRLAKDSAKPIFYKTLTAKDLTVDVEGRRISGYAAVWGNIDDAGDVLIKGCCAKSIQERGPESTTNRKIIFLWMHDMTEPVGKVVVLKEDDIGLYFEAEVDAIPEGDRVLIQLNSKTLNQFSIGYLYVWDKCSWEPYTDDTDNDGDGEEYAFIVKEINLFEISVVSLGCNEMTEFTGMKSVELLSQKNKLQRDTEKALKGLPYDTQIIIRQLIAKHISLTDAEPLEALRDESKPENKTLSVDFHSLNKHLKN